MRAKDLVAGSAILLAAATVVIAAGQASSPNSPSVSSAPAQQQSPEPPAPQPAPPPGFVFRVQTRLVTVDVVATDAHGNVVRDLKPEECRRLRQRTPANRSVCLHRQIGKGCNRKPLERSPAAPKRLLHESGGVREPAVATDRHSDGRAQYTGSEPDASPA